MLNASPATFSNQTCSFFKCNGRNSVRGKNGDLYGDLWIFSYVSRVQKVYVTDSSETISSVLRSDFKFSCSLSSPAYHWHGV